MENGIEVTTEIDTCGKQKLTSGNRSSIHQSAKHIGTISNFTGPQGNEYANFDWLVCPILPYPISPISSKHHVECELGA